MLNLAAGGRVQHIRSRFALHLSTPSAAFDFPLAFVLGSVPRERDNFAHFRMPFLTCWHHVFPLTFANGPVFGKLIPRQQLLIYRDPRRSTLYTRKKSSEWLRGGSHKMLFVHHSTLLGREGGTMPGNAHAKNSAALKRPFDSLKAFAMKDGGRWGRFFPFSIGDEKLLNVDWYGLLVTHAPSPRRCCLSSTWYSTIAMGSGIGGKEQKRLTDAHTKSKALGEKENGNEKEILSLSFMHSVYLYPLLFEKGRRKYRASVEWLPANPNPSKSSSALLVKSTHFWKQTWPSIASSERPCRLLSTKSSFHGDSYNTIYR